MKKTIAQVSNILPLSLSNRYVYVLTYHLIEEQKLEEQLIFLKKKFDILTLKQAANLVGKKTKKPKLLITFDDAYYQTYQHNKLFQKYNIPYLVFVTLDFLKKDQVPWWQYLHDKVRQLKKIADKERLKYTKTTTTRKRIFFNTKEAKNMSHAQFGAHTLSHPILINCTVEKIRKELKKEQLEKLLKQKITSIAYPNGDYDDIVLKEATAYSYGFTTRYGVWKEHTKPLEIPRISISPTDGVKELKLKLRSIWRLRSWI